MTSSWKHDAIAFQGQLKNLGMNVDVISIHQSHVKQALKNKHVQFFPIIDTCRLDNGGILPALSLTPPITQPIVSYIPAAGASSRWLAPLVPLINALTEKNGVAAEAALLEIFNSNLCECPLPTSLRKLYDYWKTNGSFPRDWFNQQILIDIDAPKALYPAVKDGSTFLELKRREDEALNLLAGEIFVSPAGRQEDFSREIERARCKDLPFQVIEQGSSLATVRFDDNGEPLHDENALISTVPAGHGALLPTLCDVKKHFPSAKSVWIRNIDNVIGWSESTKRETIKFLATHDLILSSIHSMRLALAQNNLTDAQNAASKLLANWSLLKESPIDHHLRPQDALTTLIKDLFHTPLSLDASFDEIQRILARPVVTMGQVPNTQHDVGGTCVFANIAGSLQKLCLEVPHASPEDKRTFLESHTKATHFNPVFVACEIPTPEQLNLWQNHPFWLIAAKSWRGQDAYYQESILYEMLGSSNHTNVAFIEIPRTLFNPHKAINDARGRTLSDWKK